MKIQLLNKGLNLCVRQFCNFQPWRLDQVQVHELGQWLGRDESGGTVAAGVRAGRTHGFPFSTHTGATATAACVREREREGCQLMDGAPLRATPPGRSDTIPLLLLLIGDTVS